ncbi:hypothetical protein Rsub_10677 [Raphidocelis subcapitata]|uniref:Major facilitator superfamily (MFS) profile domain-containing protein n=1 Tax=Raphidocelis subcapitata TaxID=307507 RepID=A0A2V0PLG4_9CHLO|nr:hypothetical protein Rsub_10677 [Raphidocelis subcapitata]|eukprot:GBF98177.1 hypothetical protein Rsub_10677 [Raphidocelis subcapitata]
MGVPRIAGASPPAAAAAAAAASAPPDALAAAGPPPPPPDQAAVDLSADHGAGPPAVKLGGSLVRSGSSVFDIRSPRRKYGLLLLMAFANMMLPLCDTIYLPSLVAIEKDLNTTSTATAASVAIYLFTVGAASLVWGPAADKWGRKLVLWTSSAMFLGFSFGCAFAPNITVLIVFRALQGMAVAAYGVGASAVLADTFPPQERGKAMGILSIPLLVGPIMGPLIGGGLSYTLGWRSTFFAMVVLGGVIFLLLLFFMEETNHSHVLRRVRSNGGKLESFSFKEEVHQPAFTAPHRPLMLLLDPVVLPTVAAMVICFGVMFSSLIVLPLRLAGPPYRLNEAQIGAANVAGGAGSFFAAPIGGMLADWAARRWPSHPTGRTLVGAPVALIAIPGSCLMYAWALHTHAHLAVVLTATTILGASLAFIMPATFALVSIVKQRNAAAASGAINSLMFLLSGLFVLVTPTGMATMGLGPYVSLLSSIAFAALLIANVSTVVAVRRTAAEAAAAGPDAEAGGGGGGGGEKGAAA